MKKFFLPIIFSLLIVPSTAFAGLASDLSGMILLQVEASGEAWYVAPDIEQRYYMGRPTDAFDLMRQLGLGVAHNELVGYLNNGFPARLSGQIMLDVEQNGEAYYVYPKDLKGYFLGRPADAFAVMREKGLGISNGNLVLIPIASGSNLPDDYIAIPPYQTIEERVLSVINAHRTTLGVKSLVWNDDMAKLAREHSVNMATGTIEPSHTDFAYRVEQMKVLVPNYNGGAENLAWNFSADPAQAALDWWLTSEGHRTSLENDFYDVTGIGVAKAESGQYFITQLFANTD